MPDRFAFSKSAIDALKAPETGRVFVRDTKVRGLAMLITATGSKSAYIYRKWRGKPVKVFICKWPDLPVEQIRARGEEINSQLAKGEDPAGDRRQARQCLTLGELFAWYLENHARPHKRSWATDEWQFRRFLTSWAGRRLTEIKPADL